MSAFEIVHQDQVVGKLTCFDRLIFKGHLPLNRPGGMKAFLDSQGVLLKEYSPYVQKVTERLKAHAQRMAADVGVPYLYLAETHTKAKGRSKEELARDLAEEHGVTDGLICVLAAVEPCSSFEIFRNRQTHRLEVARRRRKCLHFYFYFVDRDLGFCHVRLQSWFPFEIQVWANGREMLGRALERAGVGYTRYANALAGCDDWKAAQRAADKIAARQWPRLLDRLAKTVNPFLATIRRAGFGGYYWVADQAEIATDVAFRTRPALEAVLPMLFQHASLAFSAEDVLRFLGRKLHGSLAAEVTTDARRRPEGWRVKHRMARNSIKVYDKANVLRVETTINNPAEFRILRVTNGHRRWCPMRKGVANLWRYHQVGRGANERYLDALATAVDHRPGIAALERHTRPITNRGKRHARLDPVAGDLDLFRAVLAGEHTITGFRNHHISERLWPKPPKNPDEARRRCARTSRQIAKLRGHGLLAKVPRQRRYRVTPYGQRVMTAALAVHDHHFPAAYQAA